MTNTERLTGGRGWEYGGGGRDRQTNTQRHRRGEERGIGVREKTEDSHVQHGEADWRDSL